jgi:VWFA-related protein
MRPAQRTLVALTLSVGIAVCAPDTTAVAGSAHAVQQPPLIRAGIDLVHFDVTVTDKRGIVVEGLTAQDFEVVEKGVRQTVSVFVAGNREAAPDLHLGILVDISGSMGDLEFVRRITLDVVNRLPEATDYTLVVVGDEPRVAHFVRADFAAFIERVRRLERDDRESTALWDGFRSYLRVVAKQPGRHALVAFTDGRDTSSSATAQHVLRDLRALAVTVFGVGFGDAGGSHPGLRLSQIADETGGITMFPKGPDQMAEVHRRIVTELRSQYSLGYVSTDRRRDGQWRDVKVRLARPEHKGLVVRTKNGYFGPRDPSR